MLVTFLLETELVAYKRPAPSRYGHKYNTPKYAKFLSDVRETYLKSEYRDFRFGKDDALGMFVIFCFQVPKNCLKANGEYKAKFSKHPINLRHGDLDNLEKGVMDGLSDKRATKNSPKMELLIPNDSRVRKNWSDKIYTTSTKDYVYFGVYEVNRENIIKAREIYDSFLEANDISI